MPGSIIEADNHYNTLKYKQIFHSIHQNVERNEVAWGHQLPSISRLCDQSLLSRETALTAHKELKSRGIISSSSNKGYYIATDQVQSAHKIFLLFNELNLFKQVLY